MRGRGAGGHAPAWSAILMLGHSHALTGAAAGLAAALLLRYPPADAAGLTLLTAGAALIPDLDKCGTGPARCLGFASEAVARVIDKVSGGHRHATHSILGIALAALYAQGAAWLASLGSVAGYIGRGMLAVLLLIVISAGMQALRLLDAHKADAAGMAGAVLAAGFGLGLALIPLAVLIGTATHIAGDMLTDSGCMLGYPASKHHFHLLPGPLAFTTGTAPEKFVDAVTAAALGYLILVAFGAHGLPGAYIFS
jgi:membrane-bound metal-dependent hydrolase YbcI (DUF457 family)